MIGAGYVGVVAATCFSDFGHTVCCGDSRPEVVLALESGVVPFSEPNLKELLEKQLRSGRLSFSSDLGYLINFADVLILSVGTPSLDDGTADLSAIEAVAKFIGENTNSDKIVVVKSTVPAGTCEQVEKLILAQLTRRAAHHRVSVVSNPEFLREGSAIVDFLQPDRIIVGLETEEVGAIMKSLYAPLLREQTKIIFMSRNSAELTKYASNAMLALRISLMNEVAQLAEKVGADIQSISLGVGADHRIGSKYLSAGVGFGGSCFPKDLKALSAVGKQNSIEMLLIDATIAVNSKQRTLLVNKASAHFQNLKGLKCAVWGLSFKPDTDDIRESPAVAIVNLLLHAGVTVSAYDPVVKKLPNIDDLSTKKFQIVKSALDAVKDADMLFLLTEWREFMSPDFHKMFKIMKQPVIFDGRNIWNSKSMSSRGFTYFSIGG